MASISMDKKNGTRRILFCEGGKRKQVRLGPVSYKAAEQVQTKIHAILERRGLGLSLETETVVWLQKIPDELAIKLAAVGLMEPRVKAEAVAPVCLGEFIDWYISVRTDMKPATLRIWDR